MSYFSSFGAGMGGGTYGAGMGSSAYGTGIGSGTFGTGIGAAAGASGIGAGGTGAGGIGAGGIGAGGTGAAANTSGTGTATGVGGFGTGATTGIGAGANALGSRGYNYGAGIGGYNNGVGMGTGALGMNTGLTQQQKQPINVTIPEDLKSETVNAILTKMEQNLKKQSESFHRQACQIARCDRIIYDCMELINHLEDQLGKAEAAQKGLQKSADILLQKQEEFIREMKEKTSKTSHISVPEDQRDKIYRLAQHLGNKYSDMESQLKEMVEYIEKSRRLSEVSSDMGKITKITNCHMNSLQWIAIQSEGLDEKIEKLSKMLPESYSIPK